MHMNKTYTLIFLWLLSLGAWAHENEPTKPEPPAKLSAEQLYLRDLNARLQSKAMAQNEAYIKPDAMLDLKEVVCTSADNDRNMAGTLMNYLDSRKPKTNLIQCNFYTQFLKIMCILVKKNK
jgi:hypothetical protein